jgi:hypothetical protein
MLKFLFLSLPLLLSASTSGILIDNVTKSPIASAKVFDTKSEVRSDKNGRFIIQSSEQRLHVKAFGYRPYSFLNTKNSVPAKYSITPIHVQALYLSFWGASIDSKTLKKIIKMVDDKQINAIVVDVKNENGWTSYKTDYESANQMDAWKNRTIKNINEFMALMKSKNIYTIARIVVFKDDLRASHYPQFAIRNTKGQLYRSKEQMAWVSPYKAESYDYTLSIAADAAKHGFDEINFDYVRFPADTSLQYGKPHNEKTRVEAISNFIRTAQVKLRPYGTFISVDTYGMVCWTKDDTNIGHTITSLAQNADYLAPMLYPSGFATGSAGYKNPAAYPYEIIYKSVENIYDRIDSSRVRPWLQAFRDYAFDRRAYKKEQIQAQIKACKNANTSGWMFWNPSSKYEASYFITAPSHVYQAQNHQDQ